MNLLQPAGWNGIATGSELTGLRTEMHAGFSEVRSEVHAGFAELRSEMHAAHSELLLKLFFGMVVMSEFPASEAEELVTKQFLRAELAELENRLMLRLGGAIAASTGVLIAVLGTHITVQ